MMNHEKHAAMQECIDACHACHATCEATIQHCLAAGGENAAVNHIRTMQDCAEICQTAANFMLRRSASSGQLCAVCAEVCRACAESCETMVDDAMMRECADVCRRCAKAGEKIAA